MPSQKELRDLIISVLVLSLAFSRFNLSVLPENIIIITLVFILHEMSHRFTAKRYGCFAEYRMWTWGLILAVLSSFAGFVFAAPGAVYISPYSQSKFAFSVAHLTKKEYGKISLAGPVTNIAIGIASLVILFFYPISFFSSLSSISFYLAMFNLLPFFQLDGLKVLRWDRKIWAAAFAVSIIGLISLGLV
ncbi:MAG: M50 family metallopeptidase [Candidatus Aenigmatarchaeota archaeon]